jgi:tRNA-dihydrouridine synthase A
LKYDYVYRLKKDLPNLNIIINGGIKSMEESIDHLQHVDGVMIGRAAYENPFIVKDIDHDIYGLEKAVKSKKIILNKYLDYVEEKLDQGHDLSRMMKHLFGLSRGDKFAKTFRIKILEVIKNNDIKNHRKDLEDLLFY